MKAWAICPLTQKRIESASNSMGESTRGVEKLVAECIEEAQEAEKNEGAAVAAK